MLSLSFSCDSFMISVLLPFMSFMVSDFDIDDNQVGRYAGYLVGSFMLGQLLFSYFWGRISDIWARR